MYKKYKTHICIIYIYIYIEIYTYFCEPMHTHAQSKVEQSDAKQSPAAKERSPRTGLLEQWFQSMCPQQI